jgi:hypothetical protein
MTVLSCLWAFIAALVGDAGSSIAIALAGVAFWYMSWLPYGDLHDE